MSVTPTLLREDETDCPVCGLGRAFVAAQDYDTCARCGWVDDPVAYADAERRCETNDESLIGARRSWAERLLLRLADAPRSTFGITTRSDKIGGYDYIVGGVSIREFVPGGRMDLKSSIGPWPTGRSRLYVCRLCGGDDYEPALTADVYVGADHVIWSRIGLETYSEELKGWELDVRRGPAGLVFNAEEYRHALSG